MTRPRRCRRCRRRHAGVLGCGGPVVMQVLPVPDATSAVRRQVRVSGRAYGGRVSTGSTRPKVE